MGQSALGRGTAIEENKVKASSADATPDFLDQKVDNDTMQVVADQLQSVNEFFVGSFTRDTSVASGNQGVTGVGFTPKYVLFTGCVPSSREIIIGGMMDGVNGLNGGVCIFDSTAGVSFYEQSSSPILVSENGATDFYTGNFVSFDGDGFTLAWVRTGVPTGIITMNFTAFK